VTSGEVKSSEAIFGFDVYVWLSSKQKIHDDRSVESSSIVNGCKSVSISLIEFATSFGKAIQKQRHQIASTISHGLLKGHKSQG
jgi:hypothetical protein